MAIAISHTFVSAKADGGDTSLVQPSNWNAAHSLTGFGTGVETALAVNVGSAGAIVVNGGALGTPSGGALTSCTGLPISTGVSGLGTGVATALAINTGSAGAVALLAANSFPATQTVTPAANTNALAVTGYSLTGSNAQSLIDLAGTWNTTGNPVALKIAMTNTASGSTSKFVSFLAGASGTTEVLSVTKEGYLNIADSGYLKSLGSTGFYIGTSSGQGFRFATTALTIDSANAIGWTSAGASINPDTVLTRGGAAATLQQGAANAASPVAQVLQAQGSRGGTDTNVGGANYTIRSGAGTGTGTTSSLILQSPIAAASGTTGQTQTTGWTIRDGCASSTGYTVGNLPAAPPTGSRAHVTDSNAASYTAGIGAVVAAGGATICPVFFDGTNWRIG